MASIKEHYWAGEWELGDGGWGLGKHNGTHNLIPVRWEAETGEPLKKFTDQPASLEGPGVAE